MTTWTRVWGRRKVGIEMKIMNERIGTSPTFSSRRAAKRWARRDPSACSSLAPQLPRATLAELASMRSCYCVITSDFQIYKLYSARVHRRPAAWGSLMLCPHRPVWLLHLLWTMRLCGRKGVGKTKRFGKKIKKQQQIFADGKIPLKVFQQRGAEEEELSEFMALISVRFTPGVNERLINRPKSDIYQRTRIIITRLIFHFTRGSFSAR